MIQDTIKSQSFHGNGSSSFIPYIEFYPIYEHRSEILTHAPASRGQGGIAPGCSALFLLHSHIYLRIIHAFRVRNLEVMPFAALNPNRQQNELLYGHRDDDVEDNQSDSTKSSLTAEIFDMTQLLPPREKLDLSASALARRRSAKKKRDIRNFWVWLRWGVVIGLQAIIILLLSARYGETKEAEVSLPDLAAGDRSVETGGDINGLYKTRK